MINTTNRNFIDFYKIYQDSLQITLLDSQTNTWYEGSLVSLQVLGFAIIQKGHGTHQVQLEVQDGAEDKYQVRVFITDIEIDMLNRYQFIYALVRVSGYGRCNAKFINFPVGFSIITDSNPVLNIIPKSNSQIIDPMDSNFYRVSDSYKEGRVGFILKNMDLPAEFFMKYCPDIKIELESHLSSIRIYDNEVTVDAPVDVMEERLKVGTSDPLERDWIKNLSKVYVGFQNSKTGHFTIKETNILLSKSKRFLYNIPIQELRKLEFEELQKVALDNYGTTDIRLFEKHWIRTIFSDFKFVETEDGEIRRTVFQMVSPLTHSLISPVAFLRDCSILTEERKILRTQDERHSYITNLIRSMQGE